MGGGAKQKLFIWISRGHHLLLFLQNFFKAFNRKSFVLSTYSLSPGFRQKSAETVYRHLHHPAKTINGFLCLLIVFLKSKTHQLNLKDLIKLNRNLR